MIPLLVQLGNYAENGTKSPISGTEVADLVDYADFLELLPGTDAPAISEPNSSRKILSHQHLKEFISCKFDLSKFNIAEHERIAVILPNGPELAVVLLSLLKKWCVAPINPNNTLQEIRHEVQSAKCSQMLIFSDSSLKQSIIQVADEFRIGVLGIIPSPTYTGLFSLELLRKGLSGDTHLVPKFVQNPFLSSTSESAKKKSHDEIVLLLHTSGTSGNKKLVPYSLDMIIIGVACIICSWNLKPSDVCLNMMPLFHVGGISRNILSPILSGGCVITCYGFDPLLFWDILYSQQINTDMPKVTWYYAAPTMHQAILSEAKERPMPLPVDSVRFIANAAGGLLPVLAKALKDTFRATILTSYGMTECMPISTPPQNYDLNPSGTSGTAVGPDILIVDESYHSLPCNQTGNIMIRGPPCFHGYEQQQPVKENDSPSLSQESFFEIEGHGRGWFNTGDMGYLNEEGYLFISGRSKEVINRNGETISPFEIEEALLQHPKIKEVMVFSIADEKFQENIGALLVMKPNQPRIDLSSLHKYLDEYLQRSKWPQILIYSTGLPKNIAGKLLRVKYTERIGLKLSLDFHSKGESHSRNYYYEAECPAIGTTLTQSISCRPIELNFNVIIHFLFQQEIVKDVRLIFISKDSIQEETYYNQSSCFNKIPIVFIIFNYEKILHLKKFENQFLQELQQLCYQSIDHFLIPFRFYCISSFPRPKNNEDLIDEEKLQQLALQFIQEEHQVNLPKTNLEKEIEMLWKQQIIDPSSTSSSSLPLFSIKASFFELGGDSLSREKLLMP